uniref:Uncharacterized protein n=1 Tax=Brassica oleracea var. oleracea TaxID=109376 RepID=A0A0D3A4D7_BRAOL
MAVIVMHKMMGLVMSGHGMGVGYTWEHQLEVSRKILDVVERLWADGGNIAGLVNREDVSSHTSFLCLRIQKRSNYGNGVLERRKKINRERHSLRCDVELKLSMARKMKDEEGFYYPDNLDFKDIP